MKDPEYYRVRDTPACARHYTQETDLSLIVNNPSGPFGPGEVVMKVHKCLVCGALFHSPGFKLNAQRLQEVKDLAAKWEAVDKNKRDFIGVENVESNIST